MRAGISTRHSTVSRASASCDRARNQARNRGRRLNIWKILGIPHGSDRNAIRRSPALAEIRIRTDVEPWLADLLAETIPHSDVVLLQSIEAFGWRDGDRRRGFNPAIAIVLDRLDEWRLIESLNRPSHVHHA